MLVRRIARPMLAAMFVVGGLSQLRRPAAKVATAAPLLDAVGSVVPLPADQATLVRANGAAMLAGGALLATGRMPRVASTLLAGSLVPTTIAGHPFWSETDPARREQQKVQFLKNVGLLGGLLLAAVDTEGKPWLSYRARLMGQGVQRSLRTTRREARHLTHAAAQEARLRTAQAQNALS